MFYFIFKIYNSLSFKIKGVSSANKINYIYIYIYIFIYISICICICKYITVMQLCYVLF